jgi:hypothetical protein
VVLRCAGKVWVLASDLAPLRANFTRNKPGGQVSSARRALRIQRTMVELAGGELSRIIPGHEPDIFEGGQTVRLCPPDQSSSPSSR